MGYLDKLVGKVLSTTVLWATPKSEYDNDANRFLEEIRSEDFQ